MSTPLLDAGKALDIIREATPNPDAESCAVTDALGRVVREDVASPAALPPFDNSAMDGFALGGSDEPVAAGTELPIEGSQAAGDPAARAGQGAWEIMTGARMPDGLDRVIPVEQTERLAQPPRVRLLADVPPQQNVRHAGSDIARGDIAVRVGTVLESRHLMLLAAVGVAEVDVARRPRVAVLSTGEELVDDPAVALQSGQIRNSNGPYLCARLPRAGAELVHVETVGDTGDAFVTAVQTARQAGADIIISSGAVSMGARDFVPRTLTEQGGDILFHKLAIRPGKPLLFARFDDGTLFFGLPGNPIATAVGQRFFVEAALRRMLGLTPEQPWRVPLESEYTQKRALRFHLKARLQRDEQGKLSARVLDGQQSYRIRPFAEANAWVVTPPDTSRLGPGSVVDVYGPGHLEAPNPESDRA